MYRNILWGLVKACEDAGKDINYAIDLMKSHSPSWGGIDQIAHSNRHTDVDYLLFAKMPRQIAIGCIVYRLQPCRFLRVADNGCFRATVQTFRQGILGKIAHLVLCQSQPPTEGDMSGNSVETVIDRSSSQIG